ncbi:MAG: hypothetical protein ABJA82_00170 [Myxococcales bacterium]
MPRLTHLDRIHRAGRLASLCAAVLGIALLAALLTMTACGGGTPSSRDADRGSDRPGDAQPETGGDASGGGAGGAIPIPTDASATDGTNPDVTLPADGGTSGVRGRRLATGRSHTCMIRDDGTVWCWGGESSPLLRPTMVTGLPARASAVTSGGDEQTCAVMTTGAVWCWSIGKAPAAVPGLVDVVQAAAGTGFVCAVKGVGTVWCWGTNAAGQLGDGTIVNRTVPVAVAGVVDAVEVGAGVAHACLRRADGSVWCWGDNSFWQLGDGSTVGRYTPVLAVGIRAALAQLAVGPRHTCARQADGVVWCWGFNGSGEASSSGAAFVERPTVFENLAGAAELRVGGYYAAGGYNHARTCVRKMDGTMWCVGRGANGELGDGSVGQDATDAPVRVFPFAQAVSEMAVGGQHGCARGAASGDSVWCWGGNYFGQLGRDTPFSPVPAKLEAFGPFTELAAGENSACGRTTAGYSCWGDNVSGQLGIGSKTPVFAPVSLTGLPIDVKQFTMGGLYSCWLRATGQVMCSGGKFGNNPVDVASLGNDNLQISAGNGHACSVKRDGTLWCWGNSICGLTLIESLPTKEDRFPGTNVAVFAGSSMTCAQQVNGSVWCCGDGWGQSPLQAPVGTDSIQIALRKNGCVRKTDGTVLCGPGLQTMARVDIADAVELAVADKATCARKVDGSVWCWGVNDRGVLGTAGGDATVPTPVARLPSTITRIAAGAQHFCALDATGRAWCWGDNYIGQLGDGSGGDRPQPGLISIP